MQSERTPIQICSSPRYHWGALPHSQHILSYEQGKSSAMGIQSCTINKAADGQFRRGIDE
jgi:hypothetical protein